MEAGLAGSLRDGPFCPRIARFFQRYLLGHGSFQHDKGAPIQIQDDYSGTPLSVLSGLGIGVYDLIPDYRDCCPLCGGQVCAVRHGLYHRRVASRDGSFHEAFPVPRFRCQKRGPRATNAVTFSVLPAELVPRRCASLPLMVWVLDLFLRSRYSVDRVLDALADNFKQSRCPWFPEALMIYRIAHLFADAGPRLCDLPLVGLEVAPAPRSFRQRASSVLRALSGPARAAPVVMAFHRRYFPRLLFSTPA